MLLHPPPSVHCKGKQQHAAAQPFRHGYLVVSRADVKTRAISAEIGRDSAAFQGQAAGARQDAAPLSRTVILAVDDSQESEYAFSWAVQQLHRPGDVFKLMHCVPCLPPGRLVAVPGAGLLRVPHVDPTLLAEKAAAAADSTLATSFKTHMENAGVQGTFEVVRGPPADTKASISEALCRKTKSDGAAAIVIGSASRGGLKEALLGSIAANLAHDCDVPVVVLHKPRAEAIAAAGQEVAGKGKSSSGDVTWLLRADTQEILGKAVSDQLEASQAGQQDAQQATQQQRNLVVAIDDSDEGYTAVGWVLQHLWRPGDVLHLLHVVPALPPHMSYSLAPDGMLYSLPLPQLEEAQVEESHWRDLLLERFGPLLQANQVNFQLDVLTDYGTDPLQGVASAVVLTAEKLDAAALVVCGHSKGTFAEWLLGSVSDFAVHHSAVPVVVLHGSEYATEG